MVNWTNKHKNFVITLIISLLLMIIVVIITYLIYVFGYYDKIKENNILENFNSYKFNRVYGDLYLQDKEHLTNKNLTSITNLMFNRINLERVFNTYYLDTSKYNSKSEFLDNYFYGNNPIDTNDIVYYTEGKTSVLSRRVTKSKEYIVSNSKKEKTSLGIIKNITFKARAGDSIKLDEDRISCNRICTIHKMYSGIHNLEYYHNGFTYYSIIKIDKDNTIIDINNIDNLVAISKEVNTNIFDNINLKVGIYSLDKCNLPSGCPSTTYSYLTINLDNTVSYYTYLDVDKAGDSYSGTYKIENGIIIMEFTKQTYIDADSKQIEIDNNLKMTFNITSDTSFSNNDLEFVFKA